MAVTVLMLGEQDPSVSQEAESRHSALARESRRFLSNAWRVTVVYCCWLSMQPSLTDVSTLFWDAMAQS